MSYNRSFCVQVLSEINKARQNPKKVAEKIREYMQNLRGNTLRVEGKELLIKEGAKVFEEAIEFLNEVSPMDKLIVDEDLNQAAQETAEQMGKVREYGKIRALNKESITSRFYNMIGKFGQSTDVGALTPQLAAINLIIDDGDTSRSNRRMLFGERYQNFGAGAADNGVFGKVCVIIYAGEFTKEKKVYKTAYGQRFNEEEDYQNGNNNINQPGYRTNANFGDKLKRPAGNGNNYNINDEQPGKTSKKKDINVTKSYSGSTGFDPNNYDPRYIKDLTTELAILKSGVPYRYINGVNPKIDLLTDTAKYGSPKQIFEAVFGSQTK